MEVLQEPEVAKQSRNFSASSAHSSPCSTKSETLSCPADTARPSKNIVIKPCQKCYGSQMGLRTCNTPNTNRVKSVKKQEWRGRSMMKKHFIH